MDYINVPETPSRKRPPPATAGNKTFTVVLLSFGLLCILQAALNVSLRIYFYEDKTTELQSSCHNLTNHKLNNFEPYFRDGWVYFSKSLYYISTIKKSWEDSRMDCQRRGADLIVINNKGEQEFMRKFHRFMWIGLRNTTGTWIWVDGRPLTTSYWATNKPDMDEKKTCVETHFFESENTWNDLQCQDVNDWICEKTVAL